MGSTEPTWRVYLREWLIVWTSDADGPEGVDECWDYFARKYKGRVREEDRRVVDAITGRQGSAGPQCLQLWLPNLKGEFKDRTDADKLADALAADPPYEGAGLFVGVIQRGSAEERELLEYGRKMLPDAGQ